MLLLKIVIKKGVGVVVKLMLSISEFLEGPLLLVTGKVLPFMLSLSYVWCK